MSPEEAHVVRSHIAALRSLGETLRKEVAADSQSRSDARQYRVSAWLGEVEGLVEERFSHNPALVARAKALASEEDESDQTQGTVLPPGQLLELPAAVGQGAGSERAQATMLPSRRVDGAISLLETLNSFVYVEPLSGASDALKALIEQTLREGYFRNWPFRLLVIAFGALLILFFGGTLYLNWQVQGIANQAEAARRSIDSARDSVMTATSQTVSRVQDQAHNEAEAELGKLREMIAGFQQTASRLQTDAQGQEKSLQDMVADSNKTITILRASLAAIPDQLTDQFAKAQPQIQGAVTQAIKAAPEVTNAYLEAKKTDIDRMISDGVKQRVDNAGAQIKQDTEFVDLQKKTFTDELAISRNELPQAAKLADTRAAAFNDVLSRYSGRIDDILSRLSGNEKLTTVEVVGRVLRVTFLVVWIVVALSLFFSLLAIIVSFSRRRPRA